LTLNRQRESATCEFDTACPARNSGARDSELSRCRRGVPILTICGGNWQRMRSLQDGSLLPHAATKQAAQQLLIARKTVNGPYLLVANRSLLSNIDLKLRAFTDSSSVGKPRNYGHGTAGAL